MRRSTAAGQLLLVLPLAIIGALIAPPAHADTLPPAPIVYVAPDGDDTRDCRTPATRCATVSHALGELADGGEARLAAGTYSGTTEIVRSATISGGFELPEYVRGSRPTVLDGQRLGTTLRIARPIWARLIGLTIAGGLADPTGKSTGRGGGMFIRGAKVLLDHVNVRDNIADSGGAGRGGGIYIRGGSLTLASSTVTSNTASLLRSLTPITSGIDLEPLLLNVTGSGGGIYAQDAQIILRQSVVSENHAAAGDAGLTALRSWGGGVYATGCVLDAFQTVFQDNDAFGMAGGGAALKLLSCKTSLRGGEISGDRAAVRETGASSAAVDIYGGTTTLDSLPLRSGSVANGGILLQPGSVVSPTTALTLTNVLLAEHAGPALALLPNGAGYAHAELRYTTIVSNSVGVLAGAGQTAQIVNSVIAHNDIGTQALSGTIALEHSDRYGNQRDAEGEVVLGPAGGLALPPRFVAGDPYYHLAPESPLLDQGTPLPGVSTDFEGQPRVADGDGDGQALPDLGWDEAARSAGQFGADQTLYGLPGQTITTTFELRNLGLAADSFRLSMVAPGGWSVSVTPAVAMLGPRAGTTLAITIGIPAGIPLNSMAIVKVQATGRTSAAVGQIFVGVGEP